MNWLTFVFALEIGILPQGDFIMYEELDLIPVQYSIYTDLQAEIEIADIFFIGGGVWTGAWYYGGYTFFPHRAVYNFQTGFRLKGIEIGFRHYCMHPITPFFSFLDYRPIWEGAYEELYLRIEKKK